MSSLPTPQSGRKKTLRFHSRTQAAQQAPIDEESDEGDITQYAEATEGAMESSASQDADTHHESDDGTPSPSATRTALTGARPAGSSMPRMGQDGMISMSLDDLMAFCDRMSTRREVTPAVDDFKSQIREYQKDVQKAMDTKAVTMFDGTNYQAWRTGILADAEVVSGSDILMKNQCVCPDDISQDALSAEK
ncbi:uncharacterized protein BDCG_17220 [Blastomyces dermatitidis ER-3]|uniref:Uncharacterized protein n=1 Tax=Ajellomyces dermatitidis (strain ER-3 / ATCC MYA-2586) TaxID=559297 RepID=A0ABX2VY69_AJEDR|nr:uncharacterized protein BDCG_17220 [Blastomyces dermatitidis ER-3]OAT01743.1 hypothetical protein BDCG_17220 [Blastomyces dermatitidis ER-3]